MFEFSLLMTQEWGCLKLLLSCVYTLNRLFGAETSFAGTAWPINATFFFISFECWSPFHPYMCIVTSSHVISQLSSCNHIIELWKGEWNTLETITKLYRYWAAMAPREFPTGSRPSKETQSVTPSTWPCVACGNIFCTSLCLSLLLSCFIVFCSSFGWVV